MNRRLELHNFIKSVAGDVNLYFQPPESLTIKYPAIIYERSNIDNTYADNDIYNQAIRYSVIVIDSDPDSEIVSKLSRNRSFKHDRHYKSNNLNHDVFTIKF